MVYFMAAEDDGYALGGAFDGINGWRYDRRLDCIKGRWTMPWAVYLMTPKDSGACIK